MMTAEQLKGAILQLAMQGKLVEQRSEEGTGEELYIAIQKDKKNLIKDGSIKAGKKYNAISEEEKMFDIPETWVWTRLSDIVFNRGQKKPENAFSYIDIGSIDNVHQRLNDEENIIEAENAPSRARKIVAVGDVIYSTVRPYLHNMCIIDREFSHEPIASTGFAAMTCHKGLYNRFLFYYLLSPDFDRYANDTENSKGVAYPAINDQKLYKALVPLPPLAEQKRIVSKIEELMPFVEQYAAVSTKLSVLNVTFPEMMKKSILQEAVQGKLVPQDPNDEPASLLLKKIAEEKKRLIKEGLVKKEKAIEPPQSDDIPFDIPDSWEWIRFGAVTYNRDSERIPLSVSERTKLKKIYDYYGASGVIDKVEKYLFDKPLLLIGEDGANLLNRSTPIAFIAKGKYWVNNHAHVIDMSPLLDMSYIAYYINSISLAKYVTGTAQPKMNQAKMNSIWVPIPPLAEQRRIVAKIEELLPIVKELVC